MSPAAGAESPSEIPPATMPVFPVSLAPSQKDQVIEWYRGEFAAANAVIDALCHHIVHLSNDGGGVPEEYKAAFGAIHRRRLNWIPVLQMQKYFTIAEVSQELRKAAEKIKDKKVKVEDVVEPTAEEGEGKCNGNVACVSEGEDSPDSEITDTGSHEVQAHLDHTEICDNHEDCSARREQIKLTKGFVAKEPVKGHMVNVVKGLKMYEDIFTDSELSKLNDFVDELRAAGQNGELLGETYIVFNKQVKGNKREQIQLGVPVFGQIKDETMSLEQKSNIQDIPSLLQSVVDHLVQWQILPESRKPNGCVINYFDEGEYSHPYLKPPHLDQPLCTLVLSESTMAFGRTLVNDGDGNFKGPLMLSVKQGCVLVMRNNSADTAKHAMCASPSRRVTITFSRVRPNTVHNHHNHHHTGPPSPFAQPMVQWPIPGPPAILTGPPSDHVFPMIQAPPPLVMVGPIPMVSSPRRIPGSEAGGTGVFLPWGVGSRRVTTKQLPPRSQKGRFHAVAHTQTDTMSDPGTGVGNV